jgi:glycosyltransferase involved in cell wall biosynthesis
MRIAVISPIFGVSTGGAASYYNLLCSFLERDSLVSAVNVFSEKDSENIAYCREKFSKVGFIGAFPKRASSANFGVKYFFLLLLQNVYYLKLFFSDIIKSSDIIVVHSSFLNLPNLLFLPLLFFRNKVVLDVRDTQLPRWLRFQVRAFDYIIGCSEGIAEHFQDNRRGVNYLKSKVPLDLAALREAGRGPKLSVSDSDGTRHVAVVGLVKAGKGVDRILEAFQSVSHGGFRLHVVGVIKEQALASRYLATESIRFYGGLSHDDTVALIAKSDLLVSGSSSEGMPRSLLEALCVGTPILPPECVLEYSGFSDSHRILNDDSAHCIMRKIEDAITTPRAENYDVAAHSHIEIFSRYLNFFDASIQKKKWVGDRHE